VGGGQQARGETAEILVLDPFDGPVYAVGDVHGCLALYREIEARILEDAAAFAGPVTIVLLGDIIDRGPQSADIIDHLLAPPPGGARLLCLMGNHEAMMLSYLAAPGTHAGWLHLGGHETLLSYGLDAGIDTLERMGERKLTQVLAAHLPEQHVRFLRRLLPGLQVGSYLLAHAGADAAAPLAAQPLRALLWGEAGLAAPAGLTLVHGHYVTSRPEARARSIGIDTGAYATGRLSALRLLPDKAPAVLTLKDDGQFRVLTAPA
jgi:serine/threonine protein phosphatase 1